MRYRANKKVSHWRRRQQDPHQKQYVPLPFGGGHNNIVLQHGTGTVSNRADGLELQLISQTTLNMLPFPKDMSGMSSQVW